MRTESDASASDAAGDGSPGLTQSPALTAFARDLWLAEGDPVPFLGIPYPTRMAVIRLSDGDLFVWSPIALDDELARAVEALGPVRHLVAPNKLHHLFLAEWQRRYPDAQLFAAPGLARKRKDLAFVAELGRPPTPSWADQVEPIVIAGSFAMEEVAFFHHGSRTALLCDLIQRFPEQAVGGWRRLLMRLDGLMGPDGSTPREWRASFWNRSRARASVRRLLALRPERLVIAHGMLPHENGRAALERGLRWLLASRFADPGA